MGNKRDKKKKAQKKSQSQLLVENNKKQKDGLKKSVNETSGSSSKITIIIDANGNTLNLKKVGDSYICTDCFKDLSINKSDSQSKGKSKSNLQCSICLVGEFKGNKDNQKQQQNKKEQQVEVYNTKNGNGIKGLQNLGNTCFFNSIMQNLTHIPLLKDVFLKEPDSIGSPINTTSSMTMEMHYFFMKMYKLNSGVVSPSGLFTEISKKSPRFRGFKQQDSHELLRYLMDGLISEEQNTTKNRRDPTYLDRIFGGQLISIITCFHCGYVSKTNEPFLDLSLPIPSSMSDISIKKVLPIGAKPRQLQEITNLTSTDQEEESPTSEKKSSNITLDKNGNRISQAQLKKILYKQRVEEEKQLENNNSNSANNNEQSIDNGDEMEIVQIEKEIISPTTNTSTPLMEDGAGADDEMITMINEPNLLTSPNIINFDDNDGADKQTGEINEIVISDVEDEEDSDLEKKFLVDHISIQKDYIRDSIEEDEINKNGGNSLMNSSIIEIVDSNTLSNIPIFENYENLEYQSSIHSSSNSNKLTSNISFVNTDDSLRKSTISDLESSFEKISINAPDLDIENTTTQTSQPSSSTTTPKLNLIKRSNSKEDEDIQKVPIDLRNNLPKDAFTIGTILSCLLQFTNPEKLEGENGFICSNCTRIHKEKKELDKKNRIDREIELNEQLELEIDDVYEQQIESDSIAPEEQVVIIEISDDDEKEDKQSKLQLDVLEFSKKTIDSPSNNQNIEIDEIPLFSSDETTSNNNDNNENDGINNNNGNSENKSTVPESTSDNKVQAESNNTTSINSDGESVPLSKSAKKKAKKKEKERIRQVSLFESISASPLPRPVPPKPKKKDEDEDILIRRNASKQYLLSKTPPYLTIQLKRFMQTRGGFVKNSKHIDFPIQLDLSPFFDSSHIDEKEHELNENNNSDSDSKTNESHIYKLNGLVEHMGGINSGHYVAYVYDDMNGDWYYISDSHVKQTTLHALLTNQAYILFYKKEGIEDEDFNEIFNLKKYKNDSNLVQVNEKQEIVEEELKNENDNGNKDEKDENDKVIINNEKEIVQVDKDENDKVIINENDNDVNGIEEQQDI